MKTFNRYKLALHNGVDKETIYVAYKGKVYDVTESRLWANGKHYGNFAGQDLTKELEKAPHNDQVFTKFTVIGNYE